MKARFFRFLTVCIIAAFALSCAAFADLTVIDKINSASDDIIAYELENNGTESIQSWINGTLTENAGKSSEWFVILLSKTGEYDFTGYRTALEQYIKANEISSATTRMKLAMALLAVGGDRRLADDIAENSVGKQGIMSMIYGLHLLNNSCSCSRYTAETLIDELLSLQFEDGGWAIMGENGDIDVTAMAVQALAPQYGKNETVTASIERALSFMSAKQQNDGGYISFGTPNPESASQVLIAISSLGIDVNDERFVKEGHDVVDGILKFRQSDGSYSHTEDGGTNDTATVQALLAFTAYELSEHEPAELLYDFADAGKSPKNDSPAVTAITEVSSALPVTTVTDNNAVNDTQTAATVNYKPVAYCIIGGITLLLCIVLFAVNKRRFSNFVAVFIVAAAAALFIFFTNFQSSDEYYNSNNFHKGNITGTVTMSIRCDTLVGKSDSEYIPADGVILGKTEFSITDGETAYDILTEAARKYNIQLQSNNGYIAGIGYLYEYDYGDLSGWIYHVNGGAPFVMCTEYELKDGDSIEWLYTCELGNDL